VLVAHTYNPSYSGGRNQEDHSSKPGQANSSQDSISKNTLQKRNGAGGVALGEGPEFKPQYHQKKRKGLERMNMITLLDLMPKDVKVVKVRPLACSCGV
jgi:hypothetical protein